MQPDSRTPGSKTEPPGCENTKKKNFQTIIFVHIYGNNGHLLLEDRPGVVAQSEASSLGMQAAPSSIPTSGTFFRGDLVMKTFLRPFSLFR